MKVIVRLIKILFKKAHQLIPLKESSYFSTINHQDADSVLKGIENTIKFYRVTSVPFLQFCKKMAGS